MVQRQFDTNVMIVRNDNGTEFKPLLEYFDENGILFQISCVGTPQQNGRVERKHRHILNVAIALIFQDNLPLTFWGECILGVVYLINRTSSGLLQNKSPFEVLLGKASELDHLRVFGSLCFAHNQKSKGNKFASRSRKCVFTGYPNRQKGWKLYDIDSGEIFVSRNVKFHENEFPFGVGKCLEVLSEVNSTTGLIIEDEPCDGNSHLDRASSGQEVQEISPPSHDDLGMTNNIVEQQVIPS
ncbi:hypothetical protein LIER_09792 [Lithospermum erythrorhizon]|uniref:Integrase catalytic domain-containing protein n=1 Tax=Lithospermum erythrorhizon TaxID=34254 RepID=A0AAV3PLX1_LITER